MTWCNGVFTQHARKNENLYQKTRFMYSNRRFVESILQKLYFLVRKKSVVGEGRWVMFNYQHKV